MNMRNWHKIVVEFIREETSGITLVKQTFTHFVTNIEIDATENRRTLTWYKTYRK